MLVLDNRSHDAFGTEKMGDTVLSGKLICFNAVF